MLYIKSKETTNLIWVKRHDFDIAPITEYQVVLQKNSIEMYKVLCENVSVKEYYYVFDIDTTDISDGIYEMYVTNPLNNVIYESDFLQVGDFTVENEIEYNKEEKILEYNG